MSVYKFMSKFAVAKLDIAPGDPRPIFKQIVDGLRMQIACRELAVGAKLPSVRGLAQQLTINPNTVAKAYAELTHQGLIESRAGLGLYVAQPRQQYSEEEQRSRLQHAAQVFVNDVACLDFTQEELEEAVHTALTQLNSKQ